MPPERSRNLSSSNKDVERSAPSNHHSSQPSAFPPTVQSVIVQPGKSFNKESPPSQARADNPVRQGGSIPDPSVVGLGKKRKMASVVKKVEKDVKPTKGDRGKGKYDVFVC